MHVDDVPVSTARLAVCATQKQVPLGPRTAAAQTRRPAATETIVGVVDGPSTNVLASSALSLGSREVLPDPRERHERQRARCGRPLSLRVGSLRVRTVKVADGHRRQHARCPRAKLARSLASRTHRANRPIPRARTTSTTRT